MAIRTRLYKNKANDHSITTKVGKHRLYILPYTVLTERGRVATTGPPVYARLRLLRAATLLRVQTTAALYHEK